MSGWAACHGAVPDIAGDDLLPAHADDHARCSPDHGPRYCFTAKLRYLRSQPSGLHAYMG